MSKDHVEVDDDVILVSSPADCEGRARCLPSCRSRASTSALRCSSRCTRAGRPRTRIFDLQIGTMETYQEVLGCENDYSNITPPFGKVFLYWILKKDFFSDRKLTRTLFDNKTTYLLVDKIKVTVRTR